MHLIYKPQRHTKYHMISKRKRELEITHRRRAAKTHTRWFSSRMMMNHEDVTQRV